MLNEGTLKTSQDGETPMTEPIMSTAVVICTTHEGNAGPTIGINLNQAGYEQAKHITRKLREVAGLYVENPQVRTLARNEALPLRPGPYLLIVVMCSLEHLSTAIMAVTTGKITEWERVS